MIVQPVTLSGRVVRLEPLTLDHVPHLARVGLEPALWRLQPKPIESPDDMRAYVTEVLDEQRRGIALPFAIVSLGESVVIGATRYMDIAPQHRRLEIGGTWLISTHQRTGANTEAKLLLLTHAFETLGAVRVVFKTERLNQQSRNAILRLGAKEEGTFRKHLIATSGRTRDMVYYAIIDDDWPEVRTRLLALAERRTGLVQ